MQGINAVSGTASIWIGAPWCRPVSPSMRELPDHECIALYQRGNRDAFEELVRRYQDRVYRFILRMVGSREEALELTQDTLLKAFQNLRQWRPEALFRTWLFQIASNTAIDSLRRRKHMEYLPIDVNDELVDPGAGPERLLQLSQRCRNLEEALAKLPHDFRQALLLREFEDMPYSEIALALGINEGTVKSRLARARAMLLALCRQNEGTA
jgi:RNA polymerase sigma-70 factor (ECF subfamily)